MTGNVCSVLCGIEVACAGALGAEIGCTPKEVGEGRTSSAITIVCM